MAREKVDYREQLALVYEKFPDTNGYLKAEEVAVILGCNVKTVYERAKDRRNPLPSKNIGGTRKILRFPIAGLVRWSLG